MWGLWSILENSLQITFLLPLKQTKKQKLNFVVAVLSGPPVVLGQELFDAKPVN